VSNAQLTENKMCIVRAEKQLCGGILLTEEKAQMPLGLLHYFIIYWAWSLMILTYDFQKLLFIYLFFKRS